MRIKGGHQAGFSLVEVLVSVGLIGIVGLIASRQMITNMTFNKQTSDRYEVIDISHDIERRIDCASVPKVCAMPGIVAVDLVEKVTGKPLIKMDRSSVIKNWTIAADCGPQNTVVVRGAKVRADGSFYTDAITKTPLDWQNNAGVIFAPGTLCSAKIKPAAAPSKLDLGVVVGPACVVSSQAGLPCLPLEPPQCNVGYYTAGITLDTFGGSSGGGSADKVFGQRWVRYCIENPS